MIWEINMDATAKRRLDELMPWYVNGSLGAQDRAWIERMLNEFPQARDELEWHRGLEQTVRQEADTLPADAGLQKLMARVRAEAKAQPSWLSRAAEFWARLASGPALAVAAALLVAQAVVIGALLSGEQSQSSEFGQIRSVAPHGAAPLPVLQVTFKPEVMERDMRLLLVRVDGRFVDGPGQLGDYIVAVSPQRIESAKQQIEASGLANEVVVLEQAPARE